MKISGTSLVPPHPCVRLCLLAISAVAVAGGTGGSLGLPSAGLDIGGWLGDWSALSPSVEQLSSCESVSGSGH